jgi:hypothetical protein
MNVYTKRVKTTLAVKTVVCVVFLYIVNRSERPLFLSADTTTDEYETPID